MRKMLVLPLLLLALKVGAADVKMLLVREAEANRQCDISVMHGKLYKVPSSQNLNTLNMSIGLQQITQVEEIPFEGNVSNASAIPDGIYEAKIRKDESKDWMVGEPLRSWRLELLSTNPRSNIQFHYGQDSSWSSGCIILTGDGQQQNFCSSNGSENSSENAVAKVKEYVEAGLTNSSDKIWIKFIYK